MKSIVLPSETRRTTGYSRKVILTWEDIKAWTSGTAQALIPENALGAATVTGKANIAVARWITNVTQAFAGGAGLTLTLSIGDGGGATRHVNARDLTALGMVAGTHDAYVYTAADTIDATATAGVAAITTLTAGIVEIYFDLVDLNDLALVQ